MPLLDSGLQVHNIKGSNYGFSAKRIDQLGATEYTLVTLTADTSGSVSGFIKDIEKCIKDVVLACSHSPRADNLLIRVTRFDNKLEEVHGFKPLIECNTTDYSGVLRAGGMTALYDASHNAIESVAKYGKNLSQHDFDVNGIIFIITDGSDNASTMTAKSVKKAISNVPHEEHVESLLTVLVGVNVSDGSLSYGLKGFSKDAGFDKYIELGKANEKSLSKLAKFVTKSISMQSRALGTKRSSSLLTF